MNGSEEGAMTVRVVLTMGDPSGIGPEICARICNQNGLARNVALTLVGSGAVLKDICDRTDMPFPRISTVNHPVRSGCGLIDLDNINVGLTHRPAPTAECGRASLDYIRRAVREIQTGHGEALVTCPINKKAIGLAGSEHPGHTEMLGDMTGTDRPVMLLVNDTLRVAFVTTHVAIAALPEALNQQEIIHTTSTFHTALQKQFDIKAPSMAVCALNPHAGDGGRFGDEEDGVIAPALERLRQGKISIEGPFPSDTLFARAVEGEYDGIVAMYHDQGMIPIKLSGLAEVVNVTLGLPFVRTSPGHGTAYDIAGRGVADPASTVRAITMAGDMARPRKSGQI
ncbi:MAG: 4-hydroxythreonine-4-phosphate dehydrogenase PdxA [Planctomycetota bacterium]